MLRADHMLSERIHDERLRLRVRANHAARHVAHASCARSSRSASPGSARCATSATVFGKYPSSSRRLGASKGDRTPPQRSVCHSEVSVRCTPMSSLSW